MLLIFPYRHHPNYGESVELIRCLRRQPEEVYIVKLSGESRLAVPGWMLDAQICDDLREAEQPEIAISSLRNAAVHPRECQPKIPYPQTGLLSVSSSEY